MAFVDPGNFTALQILTEAEMDTIADNQRGFNDGTAVNYTPGVLAFTSTPSGAMTHTGTTLVGHYMDLGGMVYITLTVTGTTGGTANNSFTIAGLPFAIDATFNQSLSCVTYDGVTAGGTAVANSGTTILVRKHDASTWSLGASRGYSVSGFLKKA